MFCTFMKSTLNSVEYSFRLQLSWFKGKNGGLPCPMRITWLQDIDCNDIIQCLFYATARQTDIGNGKSRKWNSIWILKMQDFGGLAGYGFSCLSKLQMTLVSQAFLKHFLKKTSTAQKLKDFSVKYAQRFLLIQFYVLRILYRH